MTLDVRDHRLHQLLEKDCQVEQVATGFEFVEGPVWHPDQDLLLFSDILGNRIYRWSPDQGVEVYRDPSHMANGNTYDRRGRLLTCEHATSRVTRTTPNGTTEVIASHYQGKELNSPNDIVVRSDGLIYFTDPNSGRSEKYGLLRDQELDFQGVYCLDTNQESLTLLVDDFSKPNGLCFSVEEKRLFINDSDHDHIRVFEVQEDGTLTNGRIWVTLTADGKGVADGMKIDQAGNLYCAGPGGIHLFDRDARYLGILHMPEHTTNLAWGDQDLHGLYITAATSIYRLRTKSTGVAVF